MPKARRHVDVYIYISIRPDEKKYENYPRILEEYSVDRYIMTLAGKKKILINDFERILKESSVDCLLYKPLTPGLGCV